MSDKGSAENRLREAQKQAALARDRLDEDSEAWDYAQQAAASAESALVCLEGPEVLEDDG